MTRNREPRPAVVAMLVGVAAGMAEGVGGELIKAIRVDGLGVDRPVVFLLTGACVAALYAVAWNCPRERRSEAFLGATILVLSSFALVLEWFPEGAPDFAWYGGAVVLAAYLALSTAELDARGRATQLVRAFLVAVLGLVGIPVTAHLARAESPVDPPCSLEVEARRIRSLAPGPSGESVASRYAAEFYGIGCPDKDFGPHTHGRMSELRFSGGSNGRGLVVYNQLGEVSVAPAPYRRLALAHLASDRVIRLTIVGRGETELYVFEQDDGSCTALYRHGGNEILDVGRAQTAGLLGLTLWRNEIPVAYFEDPDDEEADPPLVAVFTGDRTMPSEYRLVLDPSGKLLPIPGAPGVGMDSVCPGAQSLANLGY